MYRDKILEFVWSQMQAEITALKREQREFIARSEISPMSGGMDEIDFADLPLTADGATNGDFYWVNDGRKTGEGAGAGTGVAVYFNENTDTWKRFSDDVDVAI